MIVHFHRNGVPDLPTLNHLGFREIDAQALTWDQFNAIPEGPGFPRFVPPVEPMNVKSTSCGILNVTTASASCPAWHQHAECWQDSFFGSCTPKCECRAGAVVPQAIQIPPTNHSREALVKV